MTKEVTGRKRLVLKAISAFLIMLVAFLCLFFIHNYNSYLKSYKVSEKSINMLLAKEYNKDPNKLTTEDYLRPTGYTVFDQEFTNFNPLTKLENVELLIVYAAPDKKIDYRPLAKLNKLKSLEIMTNISLSVPFLLQKPKQNLYQKFFSFFGIQKHTQSEPYPLDLGQLRNIKNLDSLILRIYDLRNTKALGDLVNLEHLEIRPKCNKNTKPLDLSSIKNLTKLQYLDIAGEKVKDYYFIEKLTNLKYLNLRLSDIDDINSLENLTYLQELNLSNTQIKDIDALESLSNLKKLDLSSTQASDINALSKLTNLIELDLSETQVSNINAILYLSEIVKLDLSRTQIKDIKSLSILTKLKEFTMINTMVVNIESLSGLSSLTNLCLQGKNIHNIEPLANLINLNTLNLFNTDVNDISSLSGLVNLEELTLKKTSVPDEQIAELHKALPKLRISH